MTTKFEKRVERLVAKGAREDHARSWLEMMYLGVAQGHLDDDLDAIVDRSDWSRCRPFLAGRRNEGAVA